MKVGSTKLTKPSGELPEPTLEAWIKQQRGRRQPQPCVLNSTALTRTHGLTRGQRALGRMSCLQMPQEERASRPGHAQSARTVCSRHFQMPPGPVAWQLEERGTG